jgi:transcriptional antiterminator NusG
LQAHLPCDRPAGGVSTVRQLEHALAWFALKTRSRHEKVVAEGLRRRGVECFLPLARARRRWSDRVREIETPLFSTYLFVRIDPAERLRALETRGAVALLGNPTPVPDAEIESLRALGAVLEPHPYVETGRLVRVKAGPFRGVEGRLVRRRGRTRLVIAVELLKQAAAMEVDAADVEPM